MIWINPVWRAGLARLRSSWRDLPAMERKDPVPTRFSSGTSSWKCWGSVSGCNVLDMACGDGRTARCLMELGAQSVLGVDVSQKMIDGARRKNRTDGGHRFDALRFETVDARDQSFVLDEAVDIVTAMYLFHYAGSRDELFRMCRFIGRNLKSGGRFVTTRSTRITISNVRLRRWEKRSDSATGSPGRPNIGSSLAISTCRSGNGARPTTKSASSGRGWSISAAQVKRSRGSQGSGAFARLVSGKSELHRIKCRQGLRAQQRGGRDDGAADRIAGFKGSADPDGPVRRRARFRFAGRGPTCAVAVGGSAGTLAGAAGHRPGQTRRADRRHGSRRQLRRSRSPSTTGTTPASSRGSISMKWARTSIAGGRAIWRNSKRRG